DLGAAGNTAATGHGGVVADLHVVRDHDLVIQLDAVADQRIGQCPAVDGGVRTDLDVIANGHATDLGNLLPDALLVGEAETLAADHRTGLDDNPLADHHVVIKRDARRQPATFANARTRADHAMGPDANARANLRAALDHRIGTDTGASADNGIRRHQGGRVHTRRQWRLAIEQVRELRV